MRCSLSRFSVLEKTLRDNTFLLLLLPYIRAIPEDFSNFTAVFLFLFPFQTAVDKETPSQLGGDRGH